MTPAPPALEARGLTVRFDGRPVLDGVDFALAAGEIAVVEGPSGCGKSTFLRALGTLQPVDAGTLALGGAPAAGIAPPAFRARVAYVPQTPVMFAGSVADNVRAGPRLRGVRLGDDDVARLLSRSALAPSMASRAAGELSGGEKQRVAIARALANEPGVILFDEPTSALDPEASAGVIELVKRCAAGGCGVVVVTHAREQARALGGTRYACEGGRVTRTEPA